MVPTPLSLLKSICVASHEKPFGKTLVNVCHTKWQLYEPPFLAKKLIKVLVVWTPRLLLVIEQSQARVQFNSTFILMAAPWYSELGLTTPLLRLLWEVYDLAFTLSFRGCSKLSASNSAMRLSVTCDKLIILTGKFTSNAPLTLLVHNSPLSFLYYYIIYSIFII